jgi:hypothetical protein
VRFEYHGSPRIVEPYVHGFNRNRREAIRGYQVAGEGTSSSAGWKFFIVDEMDSLELLRSPFTPNRPGHQSVKRDLIVIHCSVDHPAAQGSRT